MHHPSSHPTVRLFGLKSFTAKYSNVKCVLCKDPIMAGDAIAQINDVLRAQLHALHSTKNQVHKYVHCGCLPIALDAQHVAAIKANAQALAGITDPAWPKDEMGLSKATAGPTLAWLSSGCSPLGAWRVACCLQIHYGQLTPDQIAANRAAVLAGYETRRTWKPALKHPETGEVLIAPPAAPTAPTPPAPNTPQPQPVQQTQLDLKPAPKPVPPVRIDCSGPSAFSFALLPPWTCPSHSAVKDRLKAAGARWDGTSKLWYLGGAALATNYNKLLDGVEVSLSPAATAALRAYSDRAALSTAATSDAVAIALQDRIKMVVPAGHELYPFQMAGVAFLEASAGRALLGDEMGLGKSVQALCYLAMHPELRPAVLVVPSVVSTNWIVEAKRWSPSDRAYRVRNGKDPIPSGTTLIVITYDLLKKRVEELAALKPQALIADEAQYLKEFKTQRTTKFLELAKTPSIKSLIGLSGTPLVNRPKEFFTILHLLRPSSFPSWMRYTTEFCGGKRTKWGYICNGATNTDRLAVLVRDTMVRRLKEKVLTDLPPITRQVLDIELTSAEMKNYEKALQDAVDATTGAEALVAINAGRQWVGSRKAVAALELIEEYAAQGKPLLVFAHHQAVLDALAAGCEKAEIRYGRIDGGTSAEKRGELVDNFQAGQLDTMLISVQAGGVGITLTHAQDVLFVERSWSPGTEVQAEARAHRIGTKGAILVRYLRVLGTVDEDMHELLESKSQVLAAVLDGASQEQLSVQAELIVRMAEHIRTSKLRVCKAS